jgi:putative tryptophan/tyrosine transport system substrate-binding protein
VSFVENRIGALVVMDDPVFDVNAEQLIQLANGHALPTIYQYGNFVEIGGLMSYGPDVINGYRQVEIYTGRFSRAKNRLIYRSSNQQNSR